MTAIAIGKKRLLLLGCIVTSVLYLALVGTRVLIVHNSKDSYYILLALLKMTLSLVYGATMGPIFFAYVISILPERGFTLVMMFHWISIFIGNSPFKIVTTYFAVDLELAFLSYAVSNFAYSVLVSYTKDFRLFLHHGL